jgi:hypothetical protein
MTLKAQVEEILHSLKALPPEKVEEVRDYVLFLKDRYGKDGDYDEGWSDDDLRDLTTHVWDYGVQAMPWEDEPDEPPPGGYPRGIAVD